MPASEIRNSRNQIVRQSTYLKILEFLLFYTLDRNVFIKWVILKKKKNTCLVIESRRLYANDIKSEDRTLKYIILYVDTLMRYYEEMLVVWNLTISRTQHCLQAQQLVELQIIRIAHASVNVSFASSTIIYGIAIFYFILISIKDYFFSLPRRSIIYLLVLLLLIVSVNSVFTVVDTTHFFFSLTEQTVDEIVTRWTSRIATRQLSSAHINIYILHLCYSWTRTRVSTLVFFFLMVKNILHMIRICVYK